jgi:hypothetical protein
MAINAKVSSSASYNLKVSNNGGSLTSQKPISLRNVVREGAVATIENIENIGNVSTVSKTDGAFLQYNAVTNKYEIVQAELDGGTF